MKKILILGSTGSIGTQALKVVEKLKYTVSGLSANRNISLLEKQILKFKPKYISIKDEKQYKFLKSKFPEIKIFLKNEGLKRIIREADYDIVLIAISGFDAIYPFYEALKRNKKIAIANKESVVVAGELFKSLIEKNKKNILPVDSEHSAIFQLLENRKKTEVDKIYLTSSGGPFFKKNFKNITVEKVLKHPVWKMGKKITVDSATMMNKGFEIMEAKHLFSFPVDKIKVLIHPQSIVHSMIEMKDGVFLAHLSEPDMKIPIKFALTYPLRENKIFQKFDITKFKKLEFFPPDYNKFPCLKLSIEVAKKERGYPCVLNAANEFLVDSFLNGRILFFDIFKILEKVISKFKGKKIRNIEELIHIHNWAKDLTRRFIG